MRIARIPSMALILVAGSAIAGPSWSDPAVNPFQTLPAPYPTEFRDYSQLFARILQVEQHLSANKTLKARFRVEGDVLVDLSVPELKWRPSVINGIVKRD
jgi:hypothetical protein